MIIISMAWTSPYVSLISKVKVITKLTALGTVPAMMFEPNSNHKDCMAAAIALDR